MPFELERIRTRVWRHEHLHRDSPIKELQKVRRRAGAKKTPPTTKLPADTISTMETRSRRNSRRLVSQSSCSSLATTESDATTLDTADSPILTRQNSQLLSPPQETPSPSLPPVIPHDAVLGTVASNLPIHAPPLHESSSWWPVSSSPSESPTAATFSLCRPRDHLTGNLHTSAAFLL
ncbi:hypothetical protein BT69DRAFT_1347888 [Atractiella rhizophila]|nr:hypothetical protein BT69DRAFT_1347888 [Atractiella rhizophila]